MLLVKMIKDLQQNITQFMAIFVMAFISLVVVAGTGVSDYKAVDEYMTDMSFKDLDVSGVAFTQDDINAISDIDDVRAVDGYYNTNGKLELSEEVKVLISYITGNEVSKLYVVEGEPYAPRESGVWIDKNIADAKGIKVGDTIDIKSENVRFSEEVRGICYSPQYIYYVVDSTYVEPKYTQYGFVIMDIEQYPGEEVYFDELLVDINGVEGELYLSKEDTRLINKVKQKISGYIDSKALVINGKREDYQLKTYVEAVDTNKLLQILFPAIFGAIALLGILTTMTRLISRQRTTIGALKALGFTSTTITLHYMSYSLLVVFLGCVAGSFIGYYNLGPIMSQTMTDNYLIPYERLEVSNTIYIFTGILLGGAAVVAYFSNAKVLRLSASQILQPEAPSASKKSWYESLRLWSKVKFATQWNVRDISRNLFRTVMSIFGVVVCSGLIFGSFGFLECLLHQGTWLYEELVMAKYKVEFSSEADYGTVYDYASEYKGQMVQASAIRLRVNDVEKNTNMFAVDSGNKFFLDDLDGNYTKLPTRGVAITKKTMEATGAKLGDTVSFNIIGKKDIYTSVITAIVRTTVDQGIYMSRQIYEDLGAGFEPNILYTGLEIPKDYEERNEIISINSTSDLLEGIDNGNDTYKFIVAIMVVLAIILGSVILYNLGSMSYNEKVKDMATLKVLGFRSKDLKVILVQQNLIITGIGTILGVFLGFVIVDVLTTVFGENIDCLIRISIMPYIVDFCFTFVLSIIVNLFIVSRLEDINMVEALKGV